MIPSLQGRLQDFNLPQLIALLETMQSSGRLEVTASGGNGVLFFAKGQLVDASLGEANGEVAAFQILTFDDGEFCFVKGHAEREANLDHSNQALCMEAMRLLDESRDPKTRFSLQSHGSPIEGEADAALVVEALKAGPATIGELSKRSGVSRIAVCFHLDHLVRSELVMRTCEDVSLPVGPSEPDAIRVLIVDDSELMRRNLSRLFEAAPDIRVVGAASSGREALEMIPQVRPDVVSLDLHMPDMDGVATLKRIMLSDPIPTVILTAANPEQLDRTFDAILRFGAVDFITKPSRMRGKVQEQGEAIVRRVRTAARVNLRGVRLFQPRLSKVRQQAAPRQCQGLITGIAGTGACLSLMQLLSHLPADLPFGVFSVVSLTPEFLRAFAAYMSRYSAFQLKVVEQEEPLMAGVCYLATSESPVRLVDRGDGPRVVLEHGAGATDPNLLLYDTARLFAQDGVGLLMSNERDDLEPGIVELRRSGGLVMAQLPETCIDPTGPLSAIENGLVQRTVVLNRIASELSQTYVQRSQRWQDVSARKDEGDSWQTMSC